MKRLMFLLRSFTLFELMNGMWMTFKYMFKKRVTINYFAMPPSTFGAICKGLGEAKLNAKPARVVMEKPLGTSLASIMITSVSSARAHNARGAVHWDIFKAITPGILLGTFFGGLIATHMPTMFLKIFFICFILFVSAQMLSNYRPPASRDLPGKLGTAGVGGVIGLGAVYRQQAEAGH